MDGKKYGGLLALVIVALLGVTLWRYERWKGQTAQAGVTERADETAWPGEDAQEDRNSQADAAGQTDEATQTDAAEQTNGAVRTDAAGQTDGAAQADAAGQTDETSQSAHETQVSEVFQEAEPGKIRVLLRSDSFKSYYHSEETVVFQSAYVCTLENGEKIRCEAGEQIYFPEENTETENTVWLLEPEGENGSFTMPLLKRSYENPLYEGSLQVTRTEEGYLFLNTLDIEAYLSAVVPSEMPARYPLEALKAQAVCARTYAYAQISSGRLKAFGADVDDSVEFQVYNNFPRDARSTQAVEGTRGLVLMENGNLADARYYSTSCGIDLTRDLSEEAVFCAYLSDGQREDYEKDEPWYRWDTAFSLEELTEMAKEAGLKLGEITALSVTEREASGSARILRVEGTKGSTEISGEYAIRKFLKPASTPVTRQDGSTAPDLGLLPSAFFYLTEETEEETLTGYQIVGGGYGHGIGMSQNGAMHMAEAGETFEEILKYYYGEVELDEKGSSDSQTIYGG
ncbi:MAG: SpoIID/LytB domain-containing protein [Eubacteriales bacterium]|nr:SpoIID/LytB domain-containing protein [Eubacteriales bacterium]